jgi:hypothetical protein
VSPPVPAPAVVSVAAHPPSVAAGPAPAVAPADTTIRTAPVSAAVVPSVVRKSAPPPAPAHSEDSLFDRVLSEFDARFQAVSEPPPAAFATSSDPEIQTEGADLATVRGLFAQIASNYLRQLRDFMLEVRWGEAQAEWIPICEPAVRAMRRMTERVELVELGEALDAFSTELGRAFAAAGAERVIRGEPRDALLATYGRLAALLPQAFALDEDRNRREPIIVQSLLLQVPDVEATTIDKVYAAGVNTLEMFYRTRPEELAAAAGIPLATAERVVATFQAYRGSLRVVVPDATRSADHAKLALLVDELRGYHRAFEEVSAAWSEEDVTRKKRLRTARTQTLLQVNVILARLGEVDRLTELERLPFHRKIEQLESYLKEATRKRAAPM